LNLNDTSGAEVGQFAVPVHIMFCLPKFERHRNSLPVGRQVCLKMPKPALLPTYFLKTMPPAKRMFLRRVKIKNLKDYY